MKNKHKQSATSKLARWLTLPIALAAFVPTASSQEQESNAGKVEALRGRIHDMRMSLLLGGDKVKSAEAEAIDFYGRKIETIDRGIDSIEVDLSEKRASYKIALEDVLGAQQGTGRDSSLSRAQNLRAEIVGLETDSATLVNKRSNLNKLIGAVQARGREREVLAGRLEAASGLDQDFSLTLGAVGLVAPDAIPANTDPLADEGFISDLVEANARAAQRVLFEADPVGYWQRFPLRPPHDALRRALVFPVPDLPGQR